MIPLAQLLMPITQVGAGQHGNVGGSLGSAGEMLADIRNREDQLAQRKAEADAQNANTGRQLDISEKKVDETNEYYRERNRINALKVDDDKKQKGEKRAQALFDAFRKAKTPEEKDGIRQELARAGFSVDESDSDLPVAPGVDKPTGAPAKPKEDTGVGAALSAFFGPVASAVKATQGGGEPGSQSEPGLINWDLLGFGAPKAPEKPKRGGKFTVKDAEGNVVQATDEPMALDKKKQAILASARPLIDDGRSPFNAEAADRAANTAAGILESTGDAKYATDKFIELYKSESDQQFKKNRLPGAPGAGGPAGPSKAEIKLSEYENKAVNDIIARVGRDYHVRAATDSENEALQSLKMMQEMDSGTGDYAALAGIMRSFSGKAVSDRERAAFTGGEGFWSEMETKANRYLHNGRYDPVFMRELEQELSLIVERSREAKAAAAKVGVGEARGSRLSDSAVDVVSGHFSGTFNESPPAPTRRPAGKSVATPVANAPAAPGGTDDAELLRRYRASKGQKAN